MFYLLFCGCVRVFFSVCCEDLGKSNDFLGSLVIGYASKGKRKAPRFPLFSFLILHFFATKFICFHYSIIIITFLRKGKRLKQWKDCIRLPDCFHDQWHYLANDPHPY